MRSKFLITGGLAFVSSASATAVLPKCEADDRQAWKNNQQFSNDFELCTIAYYMGTVVPPVPVSGCLEKKYPERPKKRCLECFDDAAKLGYKHCQWECAAGGTDPNCLSCIEIHCEAKLIECTGVASKEDLPLPPLPRETKSNKKRPTRPAKKAVAKSSPTSAVAFDVPLSSTGKALESVPQMPPSVSAGPSVADSGLSTLKKELTDGDSSSKEQQTPPTETVTFTGLSSEPVIDSSSEPLVIDKAPVVVNSESSEGQQEIVLEKEHAATTEQDKAKTETTPVNIDNQINPDEKSVDQPPDLTNSNGATDDEPPAVIDEKPQSTIPAQTKEEPTPKKTTKASVQGANGKSIDATISSVPVALLFSVLVVVLGSF